MIEILISLRRDERQPLARMCVCVKRDCLITDGLNILKDLRARSNVPSGTMLLKLIVKQSYDSRLHSQILSTKEHLETLIVKLADAASSSSLN